MTLSQINTIRVIHTPHFERTSVDTDSLLFEIRRIVAPSLAFSSTTFKQTRVRKLFYPSGKQDASVIGSADGARSLGPNVTGALSCYCMILLREYFNTDTHYKSISRCINKPFIIQGCKWNSSARLAGTLKGVAEGREIA